MLSKKTLFAGTSMLVLAYALGGNGQAIAACSPAVSASCEWTNGDGNIQVNNGQSVTASSATNGVVYTSQSVGTLTNNGTISNSGSAGYGVFADTGGTIAAIVNQGAILATDTIDNSSGIYVAGKVTTLTNAAGATI